jgi:hypothetical protein
MNVAYYRDRFIEQFQTFSDRLLRNTTRELADVDLSAKTGLSDVRTGMQKFIVKVCDGIRRRRK